MSYRRRVYISKNLGSFFSAKAGKEAFFFFSGHVVSLRRHDGFVGADAFLHSLNGVVDHAPVGEAAQVAVVDKKVGREFARCSGAILAGVVFVGRKEAEPPLGAIVQRFLKELSFAHRPQDEAVPFLLQADEGFDGKRDGFADGGVGMFYDGAVKIYCYNHNRETIAACVV